MMMGVPTTAQDGWFVAAFAAWLIGIGLFGPARGALRDGVRCVGRYPLIWLLPAMFALGYALFELLLRVLYWFLLPEGLKPWFGWSAPAIDPACDHARLVADAFAPSLEGVAGLFNSVVATYPISALVALLFLVNSGGHHLVLNRALRKRAGRWGWFADGFLSICALAAVLKPAIFALLPWAGNRADAAPWLAGAAIADWLSFLFEYLVGVFVQLYLILHVFIWVRGLNFSVSHLIDFAVRRFSVVAKWALVVMLLSTLLIHLPLISAQLFQGTAPGIGKAVAFVDRCARPTMSIFLLLFFCVQVILTFHAEHLGKAVRDQFILLANNPWSIAGFFAFALPGYFAIGLLDAAMELLFGDGSAAGIAWGLSHAVLVGAFGAWMLASWVCLYKKLERGRATPENWIRY